MGPGWTENSVNRTCSSLWSEGRWPKGLTSDDLGLVDSALFAGAEDPCNREVGSHDLLRIWFLGTDWVSELKNTLFRWQGQDGERERARGSIKRGREQTQLMMP